MTTTTGLTCRPLTPHFGADVGGENLAHLAHLAHLDDASFAAVRHAFLPDSA